MSLRSAMSGGKTYKVVNLKDIRVNEKNFYEIGEIEALADLLEKNGVNNGRVYYEDLGDGKHYTLIGGEQRYKALTYLTEQGRHDGTYHVLVVEKPRDEDEENLLIIEDNFQRTKSKEDRKHEIEILSAVYDKWKEMDNDSDDEFKRIPSGTKKRDWIASKVGLKGRQVQEYLTGSYTGDENSDISDSKDDNDSSSSDASDSEKTFTEKDLLKLLKKMVKDVDKAVSIADDLSYSECRSSLVTIQFNLSKLINGGMR